jgi:hypothetical protein
MHSCPQTYMLANSKPHVPATLSPGTKAHFIASTIAGLDVVDKRTACVPANNGIQVFHSVA